MIKILKIEAKYKKCLGTMFAGDTLQELRISLQLAEVNFVRSSFNFENS